MNKSEINIAFNDTDDYFHSYEGNNFWIDDDHEVYDFPSFPELNSYLDILVGHWRNDTQLTDNDKAAINLHAGLLQHKYIILKDLVHLELVKLMMHIKDLILRELNC